MKKIKMFKDQADYEKIITPDDVINIIGAKGSGKTTTSYKYGEEENYIVVNLDRLFESPGEKRENKELPEIRNMLKKKYGTIHDGEDFIQYYNDIISYASSKKKKLVIEGNSLEDINLRDLKGKVIIKRTATFKSFIRAVKRDYKDEYFMNLEKEKHKYLYKITRLYKITKRRIKVFNQVKKLNKMIEQLEGYSNQ